MRGDRSPAFRFYASDWLADVNVCRMRSEEKGLYIDLLCHCWLEGSLPDDVEDLAMLTRIGTAKFSRAWERVLRDRFFKGDDGRLRHERLECERAKQAEYAARQRAAASARWSRGNAAALPRDASGIDSAYAAGMLSSFQFPVSKIPPTPRKRGRTSEKALLLQKHRAEAEAAWEAQEQARQRLGRKPVKGTDERLTRIAERLEAGNSLEDCIAVVKVYEREAGETGNAEWLNGETNWRPLNFDRALGRAVDETPRPIQPPRVVPEPPKDLINHEDAKRAIEEMKRRALGYQPDKGEP